MSSPRPEGYSLKIFVIQPHESLNCSICSKILKNPKQCGTNEHLFCNDCIVHHLRKSKSCPQCSTKLDAKMLTKSTIADALLKDSLTYCVSCDGLDATDRKIGDCCIWKGPLKFRQQHWEQNCEFRSVKCDNASCSETVQKRFFQVHKTACKFKTVQCEKCTTTFFVDELNAHMLVCERRDMHCACGQCLPKYAMADHIAKDCLLMYMQCPLLTQKLPCQTCTPGTLYHRDKLMDHTVNLVKCQQRKISQLTSRNKEINEENNEMKEMLATAAEHYATGAQLLFKSKNKYGAARGFETGGAATGTAAESETVLSALLSPEIVLFGLNYPRVSAVPTSGCRFGTTAEAKQQQQQQQQPQQQRAEQIHGRMKRKLSDSSDSTAQRSENPLAAMVTQTTPMSNHSSSHPLLQPPPPLTRAEFEVERSAQKTT